MSSALLVRRMLVVAALSLTFAALFWAVPRSADDAPTAPAAAGAPERSDIQMFVRIVQDVRNGQSYYDAAGSELRFDRYPTRSVFNWRQPLMYLALSSVPLLLAQFCLAALAAKLLWDASKTLPRETLALVPMANTCIGLLVPVAVYLTEAWAGVCIGLSILAYARNRDRAGAAWALAALFVRELAAPYCALAACLALWRRRWQEVGVWVVGAACYSVYYGLHAVQVLRHIRADDLAHLHSWVAFGGLPFLLEALRTNGLLLVAPRFAVAILAVALVAAWWNSRLPLHARATLVVYGVFFFIVGLPFNGYWGLLIAPAVSFCLAYSWGGLRALWYPHVSSPSLTHPALALD